MEYAGNIKLKEPTPDQRAAAIRICRANAGYHIETCEELDRDASRKQWADLSEELPYRVWLWMWNNGRAEWDPKYTDTSGDGRE